jgi:hypothetical protein
MTPTYAARKDANHQEIVSALKLAGYRVVDTSRAGFGAPDLFVLSKAQRFVALEVKSTSGGLTDDEQRMFDYIGSGAPLFTVKCVEAALEAMARYD